MDSTARVTVPALLISWQRAASQADYISQEPVALKSLVSLHEDLAALQEGLGLLRFGLLEET